MNSGAQKPRIGKCSKCGRATTSITTINLGHGKATIHLCEACMVDFVKELTEGGNDAIPDATA